MKKLRLILVCCVMVICCAFVCGCVGENDENRHETAQNGIYECALDVEISPSFASLGTLSAPQNLAFSTSGIATFDAVENAEFYNIRLYEENAGIIKDDIFVQTTSVDLSEYMLTAEGEYSFDVMAHDFDGEYENSAYSTTSNAVSTVSLTISYSISVDETYPLSAVGLVGKKYVDCLEKVDVSVDRYSYNWCLEDEDGNAADEVGNAVITDDKLNIVANYKGNPYTIKFVTNGGLNVADKVLNYDAENPIPIGTCGTEKAGYSFIGWCFNQDLSDKPIKVISAGTFAESDTFITLYAKWEIKEFGMVVDIMSNCSKEYDGLGVSFGMRLTTTASSLVNYTFNWYKGGISADNLVATSTSASTYITGAGIDASGNYYAEIIAQNPYDINDVFSVQSSPVSVEIRKCMPIITSFGTPEKDGLYGDNISSITLVGITANTSGQVVFDNPDAVLEVGKHSYSVTFVPDDKDNYYEVAGTVEINTAIPKEKRILDISFSVPEKMVENGNEYTITAVATNLEKDDDIKLIVSNNIQSRAGKYTAKVVGIEVIKAEYFDYQLPENGLSCDFEILSAQIRTSNELSSDVEGTFVDDEGVPYDATIKIKSADFDVSGLKLDNQTIIGKYKIEIASGSESIDCTGKVSMKLDGVDFDGAELYQKKDGGFEKINYTAENGTITFDISTPAEIVLVGKKATADTPTKSYTWLIILLTCIVLLMAFIIIFLALRVSKSLRKEGKNASENGVINKDDKAPETPEIAEEKFAGILTENAAANDGEKVIENDINNDVENSSENSVEDAPANGEETVADNESAEENLNDGDDTIPENDNVPTAEVDGKKDAEISNGTAILKEDRNEENTSDVEVAESAVDVAIVATEEGVETKKRKTFDDKLKEQNEEFIEYYNTLKDCIMQFDGIKVRSSSGGETFRFKRAVAKLTIDGKTLRLHLALNPNDAKYNDGTCPHKDMSAYESYRDLPFMFKVKSGLALRRAIRLIEDAMEIAGTKKSQ
ncbi:MAG: hypothetical protein MJ193_00300 [Clostridia bacterium]|nr:hypothetical protein [Clostridia bacterium]